MKTAARKIFDAVARTASAVLHPLLLPSWMMAVLLWGNTAFALYPPRFKIYLSWVVALYTLAIPALSVALLKTTGRLHSWRLDEQRDRVLPLAIGALCYIVCAMTIGRIASAEIIRRIMLAAACCEILCLAVNYIWKISLHMTAVGGCVAVTAVLCIVTGHLAGTLAAIVMAAGVLASARLYLGKHSPAQVAAGFGAGFVVTALTLIFI